MILKSKGGLSAKKRGPLKSGKLLSGVYLKISISALIICTLLFLSGCDSIRVYLLERIEKQQKEDGAQNENTDGSAVAVAAVTSSSVDKEDIPDTNGLKTGDAGAEESGQNLSPVGPSASTLSSDEKEEIDDTDTLRDNFKRGIEFFEDENYIIAEYYFNQVKDTYSVLADHTLYYYAKSLLMQEKYDRAEESYYELKTGYPDSIFAEKANLEYADLFFMKQEYLTAETGYATFIKEFPGSALITYCRYQLAFCQQKNEKFGQAFENYKNIWLEHPESEYAATAYEAIEFLEEQGKIEKFLPTNNQIYRRGETFFDLYWYENALEEFNTILEDAGTGSLDATLHAKTLFKTGMCYYNMRDYGTAEDYLTSCYTKFPSSSYADDSLYFLGRAYTNLDRDAAAIEKYDELLSRFSGSNYADDALFRIGRIYLMDDDLENAEKYFQRIVNEYPGGDRIKEIYWALGWIQYRNEDYSTARSTFSGMADKYGSNQLGEQGLFWKAKCSEKMGEEQQAMESYKKITDYGSFSYFTFAARAALERLGQEVQLKDIDTSVFPDNPDMEELLPDVFKEASADTPAEETGFTHLEKAKELLIMELFDSADREIGAASDEVAVNSTGILEIATLYLEAKDYINSQKIISRNLTKLRDNLSGPYEDYLYYLLYPYGYKELVEKYSAEYGLDPLYILAIIREESRFQPDAGSFAGALGLMQIMPGTGKSIASSLGISGFNNEMLYDPEKNIRMGTYYIRAQLDNFGQNKYYACGAYNGGPGAMSKWISKYGDKDIDEFIENISYDETKNYIKKVMGSYFFYQILYGSGN